MPHLHAHRDARGDRASAARRLALVLGLTSVYALAEFAGGWLTNSLALLADAVHMLADIMALGLALLAAWSASRPPDTSRTYGYRRAEILAALLNGIVLIVIALFIQIEAWKRLWNPPEVAYGLMGLVAAGGLAINIAGAWILRRHQHGLNMRAAYLHVVGDLLGSLATVAAALLIGLAGWTWADPLVSVAIGGIIVFSAVKLVLDSVSVLMEAAPAHLDTEAVRGCLLAQEGVSDVHDLHLWSLGGDSPLLSAHLVLDHSLPAATVLRQATRTLHLRFDIRHSTLQVEPPDFNIIETLTAAPRAGGTEPD